MPERTLQDAVNSLYEIAVRDGRSTSTKRLSSLAEVCLAGLAARGLPGAREEVRIEGGGRPKDWDVGWEWDHKFRLVISLKSILRNLAGTVPNRIDDLMGETANVQLYSPEVVTGYVMLIDVGSQNERRDGGKWCELLQERLDRLSGRRAPYWTPSTFESYALVRVDFSKGPRIVSGESAIDAMLDVLAEETERRNPGIQESRK